MASVTFTTATGGDNSTVDDTAGPNGLANGGFRYRLVSAFTNIVNTAQMAVTKAAAASSSASAAALSAASAAMAPSTNASSTTSLTIGTGSKSLTVETGKNFVAGMNVIIANTALPANNMYGQITSYNTATGGIFVNVTQATGGGTFAAWTMSLSGPSLPSVINELKGTSVASASTINLDTVSGNFIHVSGSSTITAITLAQGAERTIVFDGALTLTHNASTLSLPGVQNILTASGDSMRVRGDGAEGTARVVSYTRAATPVDIGNGVKTADITSASTLNLAAVAGNWVHVIGPTTVSAITIATGVEKEIVVNGGFLLVNGANLVLPTVANIQCADGDIFTVRGDGGGSAVVTKYIRKDGRPLYKAGVELIGSATVGSAVVNIDFLNLFSSAYDRYTIEIQGATPVVANTLLLMQVAKTGSVDSTSVYYNNVANSGSASTNSNAFLMAGSLTSYTGTISLKNCNSVTTPKGYSALGTYLSTISGSQYFAQSQESLYVSNNTITGFRLYWNSGVSFASGTVLVYGHRNSN